MPLSQVYGAATFYHFFTLKPQGQHTCVVCTGTACYIKGAATLLAAMEKTCGIQAGRDHAGRQAFPADGALPGFLRPGAGGGARQRRARQGRPGRIWSKRIEKGMDHDG